MTGVAVSGLIGVLGVNPERGEWPNPSWDHAEEAFDCFIAGNRCGNNIVFIVFFLVKFQ